MPQIQLLDGKKIPFTKSISGLELSKKISKSLEKNALIMEVDGQLKDLSHEITKDSIVRIITSKDKEGSYLCTFPNSDNFKGKSL